MHHSHSHSNVNIRQLEQIYDVHHILCRDDIVWVLHYIQQKVTQGDPALLELPKPRLLRNFKYFGEISMLLLSRTGTNYLDQDNVRASLLEALHGLIPISYNKTYSD
jgi:hypothetical protein